jgi:CBS domain-containing membrane protein
VNKQLEVTPSFKRPPFLYYFFQLFGATLFICLVLFMMDTYALNKILWAVGASSLASSTYGVFMHPYGLPSKPKNIFIGYTMAVMVGELIRFIMLLGYHWIDQKPWSYLPTGSSLWIAAAISVTCVMMLMALFDIEHPPASGLALVLVVEFCRHDMVEMIYAFMLLLCLIQLIAKPHMRDLLR